MSGSKNDIDVNKFIQSITAKLGAGALEVILVGAIAANYFNFITIYEPYYKYVILTLLGQTLGISSLAKKRTPKKIEFGICPHCKSGYSILGYECKECGYTIPTPGKK